MRAVIIVVNDGKSSDLMTELENKKSEFNITTIEELTENFISVNFYPELPYGVKDIFRAHFSQYGQVIEKRKSAPTATKFPVVIPLI